MQKRFYLYLDFSNQIENFLFASVATIIGIRSFLYLTGYPQIGGAAGLHIAHILWGGIFMLVAIIIFLAFLSEKSRTWASILSGIGFGFFIDELGKIITTDNNYFFQPTLVLIYAIFIAIYFAAKLIERYRSIDESEYKLNAIEIFKLSYTGDFDLKDKQQLRRVISKIKNQDPVIEAIAAYAPTLATGRENANIVLRIKKFLFTNYKKMIENERFQFYITFVFILVAFIGFIDSIIRLVNDADSAYFISRFVATFCVIVGAVYLIWRKNRLRAFKWFKYSLLTAIFVSQFFLFYYDQASAVIYFFVFLTLYLVIRTLIFEEETLKKVDQQKTNP